MASEIKEKLDFLLQIRESLIVNLKDAHRDCWYRKLSISETEEIENIRFNIEETDAKISKLEKKWLSDD